MTVKKPRDRLAVRSRQSEISPSRRRELADPLGYPFLRHPMGKWFGAGCNRQGPSSTHALMAVLEWHILGSASRDSCFSWPSHGCTAANADPLAFSELPIDSRFVGAATHFDHLLPCPFYGFVRLGDHPHVMVRSVTDSRQHQA